MVLPPLGRATVPPVDYPPGPCYGEHLPKLVGGTSVLFHWFTPFPGICSLAVCIARLVQGISHSLLMDSALLGDGLRPHPKDVEHLHGSFSLIDLLKSSSEGRSFCGGCLHFFPKGLRPFPMNCVLHPSITSFNNGVHPCSMDYAGCPMDHILFRMTAPLFQWMTPLSEDCHPLTMAYHPCPDDYTPFSYGLHAVARIDSLSRRGTAFIQWSSSASGGFTPPFRLLKPFPQ